MSPLHAIVLAIVQGVTEFIPVSSSAHLILVPYLLGWPDQGLAFDVACHLGTLLAALVYFRRDVIDLAKGVITGQAQGGAGGEDSFYPRKLAAALVAGSVPAAIAGVLLKDWIETAARNPLLIAGTSIAFGLLLAFADHTGAKARDLAGIGILAGLAVGCAQALALVPGTSRAGITITAALLLGFNREAAARFAFLLFLPIAAGAALLEGHKLLKGGLPPAEALAFGLGIAVSALVGYAVIAWLIGWLRRRSLDVFVVYRVLLGIGILAVVWTRR
ncbi:MAG TPA: undecaprenyl-diphosphate phosphatase [Thermoanaerobaculia bacterium]